MIRAIRDDSIKAFLVQAGPLLYKNEAVNGLILGLSEGLLASPPKDPPLLVRLVDESNQTLSAFIQTARPMNLILSKSSREEVEFLANELYAARAEIPGVVGLSAEADLFAHEWCALNNLEIKSRGGQKIYELTEVHFPDGVDGEFRIASDRDVALVSDWLQAFALESLPPTEHWAAAFWNSYARNVVENGKAYLWVNEKTAVSMALVTRTTQNGASVGYVYTPTEFRKRGYASGVVAELSQTLLDSGKKFCVLYTDVANPTSNKIYQEIGYREIADSARITFESSAT